MILWFFCHLKFNLLSLKQTTDMRGKSESRDLGKRALLEKDIESYDHALSHYRRAYAPRRRYLSSASSGQDMVDDYSIGNSGEKYSYILYRNILTAKNISFVKLGDKNVRFAKFLSNITYCVINLISIHRVTFARIGQATKKYTLQPAKNARTSLNLLILIKLKHPFRPICKRWLCYSEFYVFKVDMFTRRLSSFNESLVPLGSTLIGNYRLFAALWHEEISGRKKEDIADTFYNLFLYCHDKDKITLWLYNYSVQNKSWGFLTFSVYIMNSEEIAAKIIDSFFIKSGHTFMPAYSFYQQEELSMKHRENIDDFREFEDVVREAKERKIHVSKRE